MRSFGLEVMLLMKVESIYKQGLSLDFLLTLSLCQTQWGSFLAARSSADQTSQGFFCTRSGRGTFQPVTDNDAKVWQLHIQEATPFFGGQHYWKCSTTNQTFTSAFFNSTEPICETETLHNIKLPLRVYFDCPILFWIDVLKHMRNNVDNAHHIDAGTVDKDG